MNKLLQIKLNQETFDKIKDFSQETGFTLTDIVKFSVALLKWTIEKQKAGYDIYAVPKIGEGTSDRIELILPFK